MLETGQEYGLKVWAAGRKRVKQKTEIRGRVSSRTQGLRIFAKEAMNGTTKLLGVAVAGVVVLAGCTSTAESTSDSAETSQPAATSTSESAADPTEYTEEELATVGLDFVEQWWSGMDKSEQTNMAELVTSGEVDPYDSLMESGDWTSEQAQTIADLIVEKSEQYLSEQQANEGFDDGVWLVGDEIMPGTYVSSNDDTCLWWRSDKNDNYLQKYRSPMLGAGGSHVTVTIQPSDYVFSSTGCGPWKKA